MENHDIDSVVSRQYPGEKIVIFSTSTAVLDLTEIILEQQGIPVYKFDGRLNAKTRKDSLAGFRQSTDSPPRPLLITALSGGVGLDIYEASIMIGIVSDVVEY